VSIIPRLFVSMTKLHFRVYHRFVFVYYDIKKEIERSCRDGLAVMAAFVCIISSEDVKSSNHGFSAQIIPDNGFQYCNLK